MSAQATAFQLRSADAAASQSRHAALLESALDCIVTMDADGRVVDFNAAAERTFGYAREEARGRTVAELIVPPALRGPHEEALRRHLRTGEARILGHRMELTAMRRDGTEIPVELTATRTDFADGPLFIAFIRDLTSMHAAKAALEEAEARFRGPVEQVPTVTYISELDDEGSLRYISPQIERLTGYPAERWLEDPVFWKSVVHPEDRERVLAEVELQLGASIGVSLLPADASNAADLLMHADAATYQAKRAGRGGHALYDADADPSRRRLELTSRLRAALGRDELELHYQPVYDLASGRPAAAEALVRWSDPERGTISPAEFVPLAEDTGLIGAVGEWVVDAVCRQAREWQELGIDVEVAFNASPKELARRGFARRLGRRMEQHGIGPGRLAMEIIESALADPAAVHNVLEQVSELGVRVAIDDFGAGFSSLTRLRHLTVHTLKLDRTFLTGVPEDPRGSAFITAMIGLAGRLGLQILAEGVETSGQLEFLCGEGCELGQGYHLARPMPAGEATELLFAGQSCAGRGGAPS